MADGASQLERAAWRLGSARHGCDLGPRLDAEFAGGRITPERGSKREW